MICEQFPPEAWINVYTGGSVTNDIEDNGAGIAIYFPSDRTEAPSAQHQYTTANTKQSQRHAGHLHWCGLTTEEHHGYKSNWCVLQALTNDKLSYLTKALQLLSYNCLSVNTCPVRSSWKWTSRHARKTRCTHRATIITKALMMPSQKKDANHFLSRPAQVILVRTRNNQWNAHMH